MLGLSCGQPDSDEQAEETLPPPPPVPQECIRCKQPPAFTQRGTAYCQSCFLQVLSSRFTRALEGARTIGAVGFETYETPEVRPRRTERVPDGKVLVAFSGGVSSRAVLELLRTTCFTHLAAPSSDPAPAAPSTDTSAGGKKKGKRHPLPRPPVFADCEVVYVDESSVPGNEHDHTAEIRAIVTTGTPFRFTTVALEDVFSPAYSSSSSDPLIAGISASLPLLPSPSDPPALTPKERLHALLSPLSPSSRASLLTSLRHALLLAHARATGASILLLGSTGTRLAIDMLSGMASGRGWSAGEEVGAEYVSRAADGREGGSVLVVRPFALVSAREARFLCESEGLRHVDPAPVSEGEKEKEGERSAKGRSIDALVEDFVLTLDASFPSTAQTVLRTSHKLGLRSSDAPSAHLCALCGLPAQPAAAEWRAAITISDLAGAKVALEEAHADAVALPEGTGGVRAPYAPSAAHLLAAVGDEEPAPEPASVPAPAAAEEARPSLAPHLCYGCLLVLQEPGSAPLAKGRQQRVGEIVLPPWVGDVVHARVARREEGDGREEGEGEEVVGTREVHGVEAMRKEVEGFLLDDAAV